MTKSEFIFEQAPFAECHASTIVELPGGGLVAAWFGGTEEGNNDVGIWLARKESGDWSEPLEIADGVEADGTRYPCWNPVLYFDQASRQLVLFYKVGPNPRSWWGVLKRKLSREELI